MSTPSFIATLTNKVVSGNATQLGMTRQNTTNPVNSTASFDVYGRPSALSTNYREAAGTDPNYRMCNEMSVQRPQYNSYLNPSLGLNVNDGLIGHYQTLSTSDVMTGRVSSRSAQHGQSPKLDQVPEIKNNMDLPFDQLLNETRKRFDAVA
jgi:hypothetical protein